MERGVAVSRFCINAEQAGAQMAYTGGYVYDQAAGSSLYGSQWLDGTRSMIRSCSSRHIRQIVNQQTKNVA